VVSVAVVVAEELGMMRMSWLSTSCATEVAVAVAATVCVGVAVCACVACVVVVVSSLRAPEEKAPVIWRGLGMKSDTTETTMDMYRDSVCPRMSCTMQNITKIAAKTIELKYVEICIIWFTNSASKAIFYFIVYCLLFVVCCGVC
jgi:hypothetical protein